MKKVAIPVKENTQIDDHFGHCKFYHVYTISGDQKIVDVQRLDSEKGCGCKSNIASVLSELGVSVLLAGGIGNGAINVLKKNGIQVIRGCKGNVPDIVNQYLEGKISDSGISCVQHDAHNGDSSHVCSH